MLRHRQRLSEEMRPLLHQRVKRGTHQISRMACTSCKQHQSILLLLCVSTLWLLDTLLSAGASSPPTCSMAEPIRTVAFWAEGAGPMRWAIRVLADVELAEVPLDALSAKPPAADPMGLDGALHSNRRGTGRTNLSSAEASTACVHSARTGERMRSWTCDRTGTLVFEPAAGPGERSELEVRVGWRRG